MNHDNGTIMFENARIVSRNFAGQEAQYNSAGERGFLILLDPEMAAQLDADGWLVKQFKKPDPETGEFQAFLPVKVFYGIYPPRINMITARGRTPIHESEVELLDWVDIENVDLTIRPHNWTVNGKTGKKAYLKTMYITIREDEFADKYRHLEELPARAGRVE